MDELLKQYAPMVLRLAHQLLRRLPENVQSDDLLQTGMIGLWQAAQAFNPALGVPFEAYAVIRVRGAMLDELRSSNGLSRGTRRKLARCRAALR